MRLVRLALKMKAVDEVVWLSISLFFGDPFCNDSHKVRHIQDGRVPAELFIDLVVVNS